MENEDIICNSRNIHYIDNPQKKKAPLNRVQCIK